MKVYQKLHIEDNIKCQKTDFLKKEVIGAGDETEKREISIILKGAQQEHKSWCQAFEIYQKLANEILEGQ